MKEKLKNFWYYNKTVVVVFLLIFAAGVYLFAQRVGEEKADYEIAVVAERFFSDEELRLLKTAIESAADATGDEHVLVKIHFYHLAIGKDGEDSIQIGALDADLVGNVSGIFLLDEPQAFEKATNGICKASSAIPLSDCPSLSGFGFEDLFLSVRENADKKYAVLTDALTA